MKNLSQKLEKAISQLGSEPIHGPLLLGWSVLQYICREAEQNSNTSSAEAPGVNALTTRQGKGASSVRMAQRLGNQALQLGVFEFLLEMLEAEPFSGKSVRKQ